MKTALFAGTFDPPTLGHEEMIKRAALLFDTLYVGVAKNEGKKGVSIDLEERIALLKKLTESLKNVQIVSISGLVVDYAKEHQIHFLVRGIRNSGDLDFEMQMGTANKMMTGIETVCLLSSAKNCQINSTLIREIAAHGKRLDGFVPSIIEEKVFNLLLKNKDR